MEFLEFNGLFPSMKLFKFTILVTVTLWMIGAFVRAADSDPLQDFCIADFAQETGVFINGYPCRNPKNATAEDFIFRGLSKAGVITPGNPFGAKATGGVVRNWPALNTMGVSIARTDINPGGVIAPHVHNLATELNFVMEGELYIAFVANSDNPDAPNKLFAKIVKEREAYLIPRGLVHFLMNKGKKPAVLVNFFNSQNPGLSLLPLTLFGAQPSVDTALMAKSFAMNTTSVEALTGFFSKFSNAFA